MIDHILSISGGTTDSNVTVKVQCPCCKGIKEISVPKWEWIAYTMRQEHIQNAIPSLSPADRESILTGTCGACWDAMFQDDDEEEDVDVP